MADYFGTDTVVSELRDDGLLIIRINRPEVANALNGVTSAAMENIMNHAETDKAVRAIVVTGTGKVFCAGEDLSELSEGGECQTVTEHGFGGLTARLCSKPVICACNGSAAGGGMEIALSCDMVVAAENAKFGCTEVGLGIIASTGGIVRLARDINRKDCMELLLTGKKIKAPEAKALGLINYVVPAEEVLDRAIELAEECLKNAPLALKWTKFIVHAADQMSEEDAMRFSDAAYRFLEKTADGIEGPAAFVEKRAPTDRSLGELPHRRSAHEEPATEAGSSAA
ncbi:MAG: enoyl-CoA hydratase/isomerase family protein [Adlercreutzia sp.]